MFNALLGSIACPSTTHNTVLQWQMHKGEAGEPYWDGLDWDEGIRLGWLAHCWTGKVPWFQVIVLLHPKDQKIAAAFSILLLKQEKIYINK